MIRSKGRPTVRTHGVGSRSDGEAARGAPIGRSGLGRVRTFPEDRTTPWTVINPRRPLRQPVMPVPMLPPVVVVPVFAPVPVVTPTVPTTPVLPAPVSTLNVGVTNPRIGFAVDTKLLKPVPRLLLTVVGATPKAGNPEPKPPRKPLWNELPVKFELKTPGAAVDFRVKAGLGNVPTNGFRIFVKFENAVENAVGTPFTKSALVVGKPSNAAIRLASVGDVLPVMPVVVPVVVPKSEF